MRTWILAIFILVAANAFAATDAKQYRMSTEVKSVAGSSVKLITSEVYFSYAPEKVWELLNYFTNFPEYIPRIRSCESLGFIGSNEQIFFLVSVPFPFPDIWNIISLARDAKAHRFEWALLQGNISVNDGNVRIEPEGKGSGLRLTLKIDPGKLVPQFVVSWAVNHFLPKVFKAIGDRLDQGPIAPPAVTPVSVSNPQTKHK